MLAERDLRDRAARLEEAGKPWRPEQVETLRERPDAGVVMSEPVTTASLAADNPTPAAPAVARGSR